MKIFAAFIVLHFADYVYTENDHRGCQSREKCVPIRNCPSKIEQIREGHRPQICGFNGSDTSVCCNDQRIHVLKSLIRDSPHESQADHTHISHRNKHQYNDNGNREKEPYNHNQNPDFNGNNGIYYSRLEPNVNRNENSKQNHNRRDPYISHSVQDANVYPDNHRHTFTSNHPGDRQKNKFSGNTQSTSGNANHHNINNGGNSNPYTSNQYDKVSNQNQYEDSFSRPLNSGWQNEFGIQHRNKPQTQGPLTKRDQYDGTFMRISERKCREYSSQVTEDYFAIALLPNPDPLHFTAPKCQYDGVPLIVGGEVAAIGEFPHMAAIGYKKRDSGYAFSCGGSLISENFVLTAAHCATSDRDNTLARPEPQIVRLGEQNLVRDDDGAEPIEVNIVQIIKHPEYMPPRKYHDIALLKLQNNVIFSLNIRPACLWTKPTIENKNAVATGWGQIDFAEEQSDELLKVVVDLIDQQKCRDLYANTIRRKLPQGITNDQLCAGSLEGGRDTCGGDSGGPLQILDKRNRCISYVIGLTAFGVGCGLENTAGVYERISSNVLWIESIVWPGQH